MTSRILLPLFAFILTFLPNQETTNQASTKTDMVLVKGGTFEMGSTEGRDREAPVHSVTLSDFNIGRYEVTVAEYFEFVKATNKHHPEWAQPNGRYNIKTGSDDSYKRSLGEALSKPTHPIVGISWNDANAYCAWLSKKEGLKYRLPTEAEWEFAAHGGNESKGFKFSGSDVLEEVAWCDTNSDKKTHPVGQRKANELGLYDMSGNVAEWCRDTYSEYSAAAQTNPLSDPNKYASIVFRGGSYNGNFDNAYITFRNDNSKTARLKGIGFRVAREK